MRLLALLLDYASLIALAMTYGFAAASYGSILVSGLKRASHVPRATAENPWVILAACFMLGQGVLGTIWQTLAALGIFGWYSSGPILAACIAVGIAKCLAVPRDRNPPRPFQIDFATAALSALCIGAALTFAPLSVLPPGTDAMAFYMAQPKLIASTHAMTPLPGYVYFANIGLASEMHYAVFFALGGDHIGAMAGKFFIWMNGTATLALVWGIAERGKLELLARWTAVAIVLCCSAFTLLLWDGKTDLLPNGLALLAVYWLLKSPLDRREYALAGLATGLACVSKLSFLPSLGPGIAFLFLRQATSSGLELRRALPLMARSAAWFSAFAVIPFAALAIKNGIVFGEPFSPFFLIGTGKGFPLDQVWFNSENTRWILQTYPFALVLGQYPMQHGNLSVLVLVAAPLALVPAIRKAVGSHAVWLALAGGAGILAWAVLRPSVLAPRYILPSLVMIVPLAAGVLSWLWHRDSWMRALAGLLVGLSLAGVLYDVQLTYRDNKGYLLSLPRRYQHPIWQTADAANLSTRPDARVLNLMYYSSMYRADLLACMIAPEPEMLRRMSDTAEHLWLSAYENGVTHISFDRLTHERLLDAGIDPLAAPAWLNIVETKINDRFSSYEITPKPGAPPRKATC